MRTKASGLTCPFALEAQETSQRRGNDHSNEHSDQLRQVRKMEQVVNQYIHE